MTKDFNRNRVVLLLSIIVYFLVNALYVLKYAERQTIISKYQLLLIYFGVVLLLVLLLFKMKNFINRIKHFQYFYAVFSILICISFVFVNFYTDASQLNVDRSSAMDVTITAILKSEYPYSINDHLGQTSSNLPALFYIGLPFYILGDVGCLQPFCFLLISICLFFVKAKPHYKLLTLMLFLMSPAYLWEIFGKSDLMSNLILLIVFMFWWDTKFKGNYFKKPLMLAFICAFFFLTRGVVIIPLVMFLFKPFVKLNLKIQIQFILGFLVSILLISVPVLISVPDFDTLIQFNPLNHQTRYAPKLLQILFVVVPFLIAFKMRSFQDVFKSTFVLFTMLLFITFGLNIAEEGFANNLYGNLFDISYLGMIIPFIISSLFLHGVNVEEKNTMHA